MENNNQLQVKQDRQITKFEQFSSIEDMLSFGAYVIKSGLSPLKKPEDVVVALLTGKELGLSPMISINNITAINGKASLGVHIITGLLLKAGIVFEVVDDYKPLYKYKDRSNTVYDSDYYNEHIDKFQLVTKDTKKEAIDPTKIQVIRFIDDYITTIKFTRKIVSPVDNSIDKLVINMTYTYQDARTADLANNEKKENWVKYPKIMLYWRCFSFGAHRIADDIISGISETSELLDQTNKSYNITEEGKVTIIQEKEVIQNV